MNHPSSKQNSTGARIARLSMGLLAMLAVTGCDEAPEEDGLSSVEDRRALGVDPWVGIWEGLTPTANGGADHNTEISYRWVGHSDPDGIYARYKYPGGPTCKSELTLVSRVGDFSVYEDHTLSPLICGDGTVTLQGDPSSGELEFQWITLAGVLENEGTIYR